HRAKFVDAAISQRVVQGSTRSEALASRPKATASRNCVATVGLTDFASHSFPPRSRSGNEIRHRGVRQKPHRCDPETGSDCCSAEETIIRLRREIEECLYMTVITSYDCHHFKID